MEIPSRSIRGPARRANKLFNFLAQVCYLSLKVKKSLPNEGEWDSSPARLSFSCMQGRVMAVSPSLLLPDCALPKPSFLGPPVKE